MTRALTEKSREKRATNLDRRRLPWLRLTVRLAELDAALAGHPLATCNGQISELK